MRNVISRARAGVGRVLSRLRGGRRAASAAGARTSGS